MARHLDQRFASANVALEMLDLVEHDPSYAMLRMGKMDVDRALTMISLA
jgi:hypothetical protein